MSSPRKSDLLTRRRRPRKALPTVDDGGGVSSLAGGSRFNVLQNVIFEDEAVVPGVISSTVAPQIPTTPTRGVAGSKNKGNSQKKNNEDNKGQEMVRDKVVALGGGKSPLIEAQKPNISTGKHSAFSISEDGDEHRNSRKLGNKVQIRTSKIMQGDTLSWGLKVKKHASLKIPPRPVLSDWIQSIHPHNVLPVKPSQVTAESIDPGDSSEPINLGDVMDQSDDPMFERMNVPHDVD
ncbi:hypothetical protein V6N11_001421 [Hibiscus sabdariffa]|uniref:Uncharacterized protein n=1 Tax=Hibiscus sabdariffa TaxID=183260 RepID=A0ABR2RZQ2_9ROSI